MTPKGPSQDAQLERAAGVIRELRLRLESLQSAPSEPIAVIGMGCRFPGGCDTPASLWRLIASGGDAVTEVPGDRAAHWAGAGAVTRYGGFLERVDLFDPEFFGIAPREAERMDPQQRLMMEVAWEAMEDAGQDLARLRGSRTGVFAGVHSASNDYYQFQLSAPDRIDTYTGTGCAHDVVAGRLSYAFDWRGPAMAVNTACSSSLVAVHLACQSLRSGDSNLALAAGVNVILSPGFSLAVAKLEMLSPDGRCKAFDERADGFVRGEGCGAVVLKRLSDALRDGDRIRAVIRGSAVNQDGRSNGLTAPNGLAQEDVIRTALARAGVAPEAIGYLEAHGTGTALGDPIEFDSLCAVLGAARGGRPGCQLGSVKANVGHLEACAGIAGLIKTVLCLENEAIPPLALFRKISLHIRLEGTPFTIPRELTAWPRGARPRFAGVSSFGWSGTNAHVVLEEGPRREAGVAAPVEGWLLPVSAHTPAALRALAGRYAAHVETAESGAMADFCYSAACRRTHHPQRLAVFRRSAQELAGALRAFAETGSAMALAQGRAPLQRPAVAFVFTGQGSQWWAMGRELFETFGVFREVIERCAECLSRVAGWDLLAEWKADEAQSRLWRTQYAQPALFALQAGLVALWRDWGCEPAAVAGHSAGEIAAAYTAGALTLEEAVRIAAHRGRTMQAGAGRGGMVSVGTGVDSLRPLLVGLEDRVAIAAMNSPVSSVLSGEKAALDALVARLAGEGVACQPLRVDCAFHSPHMDACRDEFAAALGTVRAKSPLVTFVSTVTGSALHAGEDFSAAYWARGVREPVRFASAILELLESGIQLFLQIGPHPALSGPIAECGDAARKPATPIASLRRGIAERETMLRAAGDLYVGGCDLEWSKISPPGRPVPLPSYPWQRKRYWLPYAEPVPAAAGNWRYEIAWEPQPLAKALEELGDAGLPRPSEWLIVGDDSPLTAAIVQTVRGEGGRCTATDPSAARVRDRHGTVVYLWDANGQAAEEPASSGCSRLLALAQAAAERPDGGAKLWVVTRGAQPAGEPVSRPAAAPAWGLGRVIALEHPEIWGGLIDAGQEDDAETVARGVVREILAESAEDQVALRAGRRYVARLRSTGEETVQPVCLDPAGTYLITGGLGAVGPKIARWIVERGGRKLVLAGRSGMGTGDLRERRARIVEQLRARGAEVEVITADVSDEEAMRRIFAEFAARGEQIRGICHAAVNIQLRPLADATADTLSQTFRTKARGAWILHKLSMDLHLDFFLLFSSAAAAIGARNMGEYAAANEYLDALASYRQAHGLPALAIDWGAWDQIGSISEEEKRSVMRAGFHPMSEPAALQAMNAALQSKLPRVVIADIDWQVLKGAMEARRRRPFLDEIDAASPSPAPVAAQSSLLERLAAARTPDERRDLISNHVGRELRAILGLDAAVHIEPDRGFFSLGMDSLMAVQLRRTLEAATGLSLPNSLTFNYPNIDALTKRLMADLGYGRDEGAPEAPRRRQGDDLEGLSEQEIEQLLAAEARSLSAELGS